MQTLIILDHLKHDNLRFVGLLIDKAFNDYKEADTKFILMDTGCASFFNYCGNRIYELQSELLTQFPLDNFKGVVLNMAKDTEGV